MVSEARKFINLETIGARFLLWATLLALILSNSPLHNYYNAIFHTDISAQIGNQQLKMNFLDVINHGLMTIFFLVVGLEIKYELLQGTLNSMPRAALPAIGAIGGMLLPALIYIGINYRDTTHLAGWAVPTATDIAFALSIISFLGRRVPSALKIFLTALAILDDLAAIMIIAIFYTHHLSVQFLLYCLFGILLLLLLNRMNVTRLSVYCVLGMILWFCFLKSGIHATLAGVTLAFMVPVHDKKKPSYSPLRTLQHKLHPVTALVILPLFALANAGVSIVHLRADTLQPTIVLGVLLGLFLGKQLGVFGACWLAVKLRVAALPEEVGWHEFYAVTILCGIGFTISLFIGALAFSHDELSYLNSVKVGVLAASMISGGIGYLLLRLRYAHHSHP